MQLLEEGASLLPIQVLIVVSVSALSIPDNIDTSCKVLVNELPEALFIVSGKCVCGYIVVSGYPMRLKDTIVLNR